MTTEPNTPPRRAAARRHRVTAVLVSHNGERWLRDTLGAVRAQRRLPDRMVAVDNGSRDRSRELLRSVLGPARVLERGGSTGFGAAVAAAVAATDTVPAPTRPGEEVVEWIWLLHDDSAPAPDALARLLGAVDAIPSVGVAGCKIRGWYDRRHLREVGFTVSRGGRRETGLERREQDQGQHDGTRDVMAVNSAGLLVRRDVWNALGGFDARLPLFRDDLDLCWRAQLAGHRVVVVPAAVIYHAEAASHDRRAVSAARVHRPHYLDRRSAMYALLVNLPLASLPLTAVRLLTGSLVRALGFLLAKMPGHAVDELLALVAVSTRPWLVLRARRRRVRNRRLAAREVLPLLAPRWSHVRQIVDGAMALLPGGRPEVSAGRHAAVEAGPVAAEAENLVARRAVAMWTRWVRLPSVQLVLGLLLLALLASRGLIGSGRLMGGALLPAPSGASDLWSAYTSAWHPVGLGSDTAAPAYLAVLGLLSVLTFGNASLVVDVLLIGAVPLAALTAYFAAGRVVRSRLLRAWAGAAYALLPAVTGAVAAGRLGTAGAAVLLPLLALGTARLLRADEPAPWWTAWLTGLGLAVVTAFVPLAWAMGVLLAVVAVLTRARARPVRARLAVAVLTPGLVLFPWSLHLLGNPALLLLEVGVPGPDLSDPSLDPLSLLLLHPGGPGMYPVVLSAGLVLAALFALLRPTRRGPILAGWLIALVAFAVGLVMSRVEVTPPTLGSEVAPWPGLPSLVMGAGMLLAALVGGEGVRGRVAATSWGWRQPAAVTATAVALAVPVLAGGWWAVTGSGDPLDRRDPVLLPAYVAADSHTPDRPRTLVLRQRDDQLAYALVRESGSRLGDHEMSHPHEDSRGLDGVVVDLVSGQSDDAASRLADYGVRYIVVARPVAPAVAEVLDTSPGLKRMSAAGGDGLWRVQEPTARVRIVAEDGTSEPVPADQVSAGGTIPAGDAGRTLVLAERADDGWEATLDGRPLEPGRHDGWAQAFALPAEGGTLSLDHDGGGRTRALLGQAVVVLVIVVLALPGGGRRRADDDETPESTPPRGSHRAAEGPPAAGATYPETSGTPSRASARSTS